MAHLFRDRSHVESFSGPIALATRLGHESRERLAEILLARGISLQFVLDNTSRAARNVVLLVAGITAHPATFESCAQLRKEFPTAPLLVIAESESEALAVASFRAGAVDYLSEPVSTAALSESVGRCLGPAANPAPMVDRLIGSSEALEEIRQYVYKVGPVECNVLITGETGTGKELIAEQIHRHSRRAGKPLVPINCAALPDTLLESELFGHERGAFTGAFAMNVGQLEAANGGTVFFDEIGEMSPYAQSKILRAIESREVSRLGGRRRIPVDIRIIAATNRNLDVLADTNSFRSDLYFRLNVGRVHLPPLRERKTDILEIAQFFIIELNRKFRAQVSGLDVDLSSHFLEYEWPGNVRELRNVLEGMFITRGGAELIMKDLPLHHRRRWSQRESAIPPGSERVSADPELSAMISALDEAQWNKSKAADRLKWSRMTLYRKMAKYQLADRKSSSKSA